MVLVSDKDSEKYLFSWSAASSLTAKLVKTLAFLKQSHYDLNLITAASPHNRTVERDFSIVQYYRWKHISIMNLEFSYAKINS